VANIGPHLRDLSAAAQRLLKILTLSSVPEIQNDEQHEMVAIHLVNIEMALLLTRWGRLKAALKERESPDPEISPGGKRGPSWETSN